MIESSSKTIESMHRSKIYNQTESTIDFSKLIPVFQRYAQIDAVYLFGSVATGTPNRFSDIDLAIVTKDVDLRRVKLDLIMAIEATGIRNVDLLFFPIESYLLAFEAVRLHEVIYQREDFDRGSFFSLIARQYFDFQPFIQAQREAYKRRSRNG